MSLYLPEGMKYSSVIDRNEKGYIINIGGTVYRSPYENLDFSKDHTFKQVDKEIFHSSFHDIRVISFINKNNTKENLEIITKNRTPIFGSITLIDKNSKRVRGWIIKFNDNFYLQHKDEEFNGNRPNRSDEGYYYWQLNNDGTYLNDFIEERTPIKEIYFFQPEISFQNNKNEDFQNPVIISNKENRYKLL